MRKLSLRNLPSILSSALCVISGHSPRPQSIMNFSRSWDRKSSDFDHKSPFEPFGENVGQSRDMHKFEVFCLAASSQSIFGTSSCHTVKIKLGIRLSIVIKATSRKSPICIENVSLQADPLEILLRTFSSCLSSPSFSALLVSRHSSCLSLTPFRS